MINNTNIISNSKTDLLNALNMSSGTTLSYNSSIENIINTQGGTILYSYDNIIIASEITESFYNELSKNPYIEYIDSLPLKKYGDINYDLINQIQTNTGGTSNLSSIPASNSGSTLNGPGSQYTNIFTTGINVTGFTNDITNSINTLNTLTTTLQDGVSGKTTLSNSGDIHPTITNEIFSLSAETNSSFNYIITATGTFPIKYEIIPPSNYTGTIGINLNKISGVTSMNGVYNFTYSAINYYGSASKDLVLTVVEYVKITNTNLIINSSFGSNITYQILSNGNPISYDAKSLPDGLSINHSTGVISGICNSTGSTISDISASGLTGSDSKPLSINSGYYPIISSSGSVSGSPYTQFSYVILSNDSKSTYKIIGNLPSGLNFSNNTISGTPNSPGITNVSIKAINSFGESTKNLTITISNIVI